MLNKETRPLLLKAVENGIKVTDVAKAYCVDRSTVNRLIRQMKETGSVEPRTHLRGRKPSLPEEDLRNIDNLLKEQPDLTISEIKETLQTSGLRRNCPESRPEAGICVQKEITARQRTGASPMYRNRERTGTDFLRNTTQRIWYFWMRAVSIST